MSITKPKSQVQIEQQFLYNLAQVLEAFPQYTIAQHLSHFMRKKNDNKEAYFWSNELLLSKIEEYYDELKSDLTLNIETED